MNETERSKRAWMQMVALIAAFVLPVLIAALLASGRFGWHGGATLNAGALLNPTVPLADLWPDTDWRGVPGFWRAVVVGRGGCAAECQQAFSDLELLRHGLGRRAERLQLVYLGEAGTEPPQQGDALNVHWGAAGQLSALEATLLEQLPATQVTGGSVYLLDWRGDLMMAYAPGVGPDPLATDLERLFKTLRID